MLYTQFMISLYVPF